VPVCWVVVKSRRVLKTYEALEIRDGCGGGLRVVSAFRTKASQGRDLACVVTEIEGTGTFGDLRTHDDWVGRPLFREIGALEKWEKL